VLYLLFCSVVIKKLLRTYRFCIRSSDITCTFLCATVSVTVALQRVFHKVPVCTHLTGLAASYIHSFISFFCQAENIRIVFHAYHFFFWHCGPTRAMASSFFRFLDHTPRRTTVGRTPLDEWSVRRRDFYLTTHNTHNKHPWRRWVSNPRSQQASGRRPTPQTARPLGPAFCYLHLYKTLIFFHISFNSWRQWGSDAGDAPNAKFPASAMLLLLVVERYVPSRCN